MTILIVITALQSGLLIYSLADILFIDKKLSNLKIIIP